MKKYIYILFFLFVQLSCSKTQKEEELTKIYEELMQVHDELMLKMHDVSRLKKELSDKKVIWIQDSVKYTESIIIANSLIEKLDNVNKEMMAWMHSYSDKDYKSMEKETAKTYLRNEKEKVMNMKEKMLSGIKDTREFIEKPNP